MYVCEICGKELRSLKALKYHIEHVHNIEKGTEEYENIISKYRKKRGGRRQEPEEKKEEKEEIKEEITEKEVEGGVEEKEVSEDTEELKKQLIELANEGENEEEEKEIEEEKGIGESLLNLQINLDDEDVGELYLNILGIEGMMWGYDVYSDEVLRKRAIRRGKLLKVILGKYVENEENLAIVILASDFISDTIYIRQKSKQNKGGDKCAICGKNW